MCSGACAHRLLFIGFKVLLLQAIGTFVQIHVLQQCSRYTTSLHVLLPQSSCLSAPPMKRTCCWLSMESSSLLSASGSCAWLLFCVEATQLSGPNNESCPSIEMVWKKENTNALNLYKVSRNTKSTPRNRCGNFWGNYLLLVLLMLQKLLLKLLQVLLL